MAQSEQTWSAQTWPSRSIVIIVPFPAGGSADLSARLLAEELKTAFGQPVVVESKPGAGGNLAAAAAARAEADGYTLFIGTNGTARPLFFSSFHNPQGQRIAPSYHRRQQRSPAIDQASDLPPSMPISPTRSHSRAPRTSIT